MLQHALPTKQAPHVKFSAFSDRRGDGGANDERKVTREMANPNRLTAQQVIELIKELTGDEIKVNTFYGYVSRGQAPKAVEKIGNTSLWKKSEITEWALNRPGRGARTDLPKTRRRTKDTDDA